MEMNQIFKTHQPVYVIVLLLSSLSITAQIETQHVIASQGGYVESSDLSISWTIGDTYVKTAQMDQKILTQGFQQSFITRKIKLNQYTNLNVVVFPNPTRDKVTVEIKENKGTFRVVVYDLLGRIVRDHTSSDKIRVLDFNSLRSGVYYVHVLNSDELKQSIYEVIRL